MRPLDPAVPSAALASAPRSAEGVEGFPPVCGPAPRVLILGSIPGRASLRAGAYYAHPRNLFWPLMGELFGAGPALPYDERLRRLTAAGVALWDVLGRCERPGSLDQSIVAGSEVPNPIGPWLAAHPSVARVGLNGRAAHALFRRHVLPTLDAATRSRVAILGLPSTSPANASVPVAAKRAAWAALV